MVRVRFAPSPTGDLHIGNARTAIYNYLFAKANQGTFIVRVEDTDVARSTEESFHHLIEDLKWLNITWDEGPEKEGSYGPYFQSQRLNIYKEYAEKLIHEGKAYYCFATDEELEQMKEVALRENRPPHYEGIWKDPRMHEEALKRIAQGQKPVIRFRVPLKSYVLHDEVRGRIVYPENMVGDFVLIRSNDLPTYNFCNIVDDSLMKITHVIRGEDHLSNTLRQLMLYEAFQLEPPIFCHLSLLINHERQKLSKRDGATSVRSYREMGYEAEALLNYLCLLGWSHPEGKDIFTAQEVIPFFNLNRLSKSPAIYDLKKLQWINGEHLRRKDLEELLNKLFLDADHEFYRYSLENQKKALQLFKNQIVFVSDFKELLNHYLFFTKKEKVLEGEDLVKNLQQEEFYQSVEFLLGVDPKEMIQKLGEKFQLKGKNLFLTVRYLLTGKMQGPELPDLLSLLSKERLLQRIS